MTDRHPLRLTPLPADEWDDRARAALASLIPAERANPTGAGNVLSTLVRHPDLTRAYLPFNAYLLNGSTLVAADPRGGAAARGVPAQLRLPVVSSPPDRAPGGIDSTARSTRFATDDSLTTPTRRCWARWTTSSTWHHLDRCVGRLGPPLHRPATHGPECSPSGVTAYWPWRSTRLASRMRSCDGNHATETELFIATTRAFLDRHATLAQQRALRAEDREVDAGVVAAGRRAGLDRVTGARGSWRRQCVRERSARLGGHRRTDRPHRGARAAAPGEHRPGGTRRRRRPPQPRQNNRSARLG